MSDGLTNEPALPEGWRLVHLGEVFTFTKKPNGLRFADFDRIPFVPMELIPIGNLLFDTFLLKAPKDLTSGTYFERGDVLVSKITPSFENGKQGIIDELPIPFGIATTEVIPIQDISGVSDRFFLFYYLLRRDVRSELTGKMEGTTGRQRLSKSTLENLEIWLPPLPEQRAIAHALRTMQAAREARRREAALERERKAALMQRLFTQGTRGEPTKTTEIGEVPVTWTVAPFKTILLSGTQNGIYKPASFYGRGYQIADMKDVFKGDILQVGEMDLIDLNDQELAKFGLHEGDLLFARRSFKPEGSGKCQLVPLLEEPVVFSSSLIRVSLASTALPQFYAQFFQSAIGRRIMAPFIRVLAVSGISGSDLKNLLVPIFPVDEQRTIAEVLRACDEQIAALEREAAAHDELFRALLEELMTGRGRVGRWLSNDDR